MIIFDIETAPQPLDDLKTKIPEFDESNVKTGNLKDPDKIAAKVQEAKDNHVQDFVDRAPLDPAYGRVLVIGYYSVRQDRVIIHDGVENSEWELLTAFWSKVESCRREGRKMVGLNIHDFDLPFLRCRSWINDVPVPQWVIKQDRYWDDTFLDLRKSWLSGRSPMSAKSNFDTLAAAFGSGGKPDDMTGADFAKAWLAGGEEKEKARKYLEGDLRQPATWAKAMGLFV